MRRALSLAVVGAVLVVAFAGVALAATIQCTGGPCFGTNNPDQITGSAQADQIEARAGDDTVNAGTGGDDLFGDQGNDTIDALDTPPLRDTLVSGGTGNDTCFFDPGVDQPKNCEIQNP
jgi:Ca2+-binding RTX toxin-like protein